MTKPKKFDSQDFAHARKGQKVVVSDGRTGVLTGMHLTPDGPALRVKVNPGSIVDETVLYREVEDIVGARKGA